MVNGFLNTIAIRMDVWNRCSNTVFNSETIMIEVESIKVFAKTSSSLQR